MLATKVHFALGEGRNRSGSSRRWILTEVAALDRIDDIVPPGANLYEPNWRPPVLSDAARRRRPPADRVAA